ncbi:uncharacterized protein Z519_12294 [Cladophialophora bantiana CBS 173.52]|uniref:Uncharacterized protein n=1 Tax=Cladophialophora bantiana (strain ATCC 10958 / CBS 173.52 / CDC B-1940 / NIH 8579) TaxID=1442370 RepID=A0A0D2H1N2_CLAB1|nr:uncharacterized protein Z519_12294 [Cladophialophora bantiana CBS 173.52]KIW87183.1 hypothetical protein Z519_12294 [Cladophialophora bantiana CBS 173.52]
MFVPDSPRLLLMQNRYEETFKAFQSCRTKSVDKTDQDAIQEEYYLLHLQVPEEMKDPAPLIDFFKRPTLRKRCFVAFLVMCAAQGTGTLAIKSSFSRFYSRSNC